MESLKDTSINTQSMTTSHHSNPSMLNPEAATNTAAKINDNITIHVFHVPSETSSEKMDESCHIEQMHLDERPPVIQNPSTILVSEERLVSLSEVFQAALKGSWSQNAINSSGMKTFTLNIDPTISTEAVNVFLNYIKGDQIDVTPENVTELLAIADEYAFDDLQEKCVACLQSILKAPDLDIESLGYCFELADRYQISALMLACEEPLLHRLHTQTKEALSETLGFLQKIKITGKNARKFYPFAIKYEIASLKAACLAAFHELEKTAIRDIAARTTQGFAGTLTMLFERLRNEKNIEAPVMGWSCDVNGQFMLHMAQAFKFGFLRENSSGEPRPVVITWPTILAGEFSRGPVSYTNPELRNTMEFAIQTTLEINSKPINFSVEAPVIGFIFKPNSEEIDIGIILGGVTAHTIPTKQSKMHENWAKAVFVGDADQYITEHS